MESAPFHNKIFAYFQKQIPYKNPIQESTQNLIQIMLSTLPSQTSSFIFLRSPQINEAEGLDSSMQNFIQLDEHFHKINSMLKVRLDNIKNKVTDINGRVIVCKRKIEMLRYSQQALNVQSPAKFVKTYKGASIKFETIINPDYDLNLRQPWINGTADYKLNPKAIKIESKAPEIRGDKADMINLIYKELKQRREMFEGQYSIQQQNYEGLGNIPRNIKFIESLLVFNSNINPYQKYSSFDNLTHNKHLIISKKRVAEEKINLAEAPKTLVEGTLQEQSPTEFKFKPAVKEIHHLNLPSNLNLKGIVSINLESPGDDSFQPSRKIGTLANASSNINQASAIIPTNLPNISLNLQEDNIQLNPISLPNIQMTSSHLFIGQISKNELTIKTGNQMQPPSFNQINNNVLPTNLSSRSLSPINAQNIDNNNKFPSFKPIDPVVPKLDQPQPKIQPQVNISLPPPKLNLPAPGGGTLPPPPIVLPVQKLTPPPGGIGEQNPPAATDKRAALLDEIRNPNNIKKLKPVKKEENAQNSKNSVMGPGSNQKNQPKTNHLEYLKHQIQLRYKALHREYDSESDSHGDDDQL